MILKELNLVSFGKFQKKSLQLEEGINILYGENEAGKTTIYNFIDGMFYGFLRPYVSRRYFSDELKKYKPWYGEQYSGIMTLSKDEKMYKIERDFNRKNVKVYDDLTGNDITDEIDMGRKIKDNLPGLYFFDFNSTVYKNTISIKQLGNRIDSNLSKEVKDKLANISTSLDDEISVKKAIQDLEKQLKDIGTERAYTSPYGETIKKLKRLEEKKKLDLEKQEEYNKCMDIFLKTKEHIEEENNKVLELKSKLDKLKIFEKKKIYEEALKTKNEINKIDEELKSLKKYSSLSSDEYYKCLKIDNERKNLIREINDLFTRIKDIDTKLKDLKLENDDGIIKGIKVDELYNDISSYNQMEEEKNKLVINNQENRLEILNSELKGIEEKLHKSKLQSIIFFILGIGSIGLTFINYLFFILVGISGVLAIYLFSSSKRYNKDIDDLNNRINELDIQEYERNKRIDSIELSQKDIIAKYNCSTKVELNRLYDEIRFAQANKNERLNQIRELDRDKKKTKSNLEIKEDEKKELQIKLNEIISKNNSNSLDEFREGLNKKKAYDDLLKDRENKIQLLNRILENTSLEKLKSELANYNDKYFEDQELIDKNVLIKEIKNREKDLSDKRNTYSRLEERIENLNKYVKDLVDIEENINRTKNKIKSMDNRIKSIDIAKEVIDDIAQEIHNQFAPKINKDVSQLIKVVTDGKYEKVRINEDLDIVIENPSTEKIVDIDSLSGGTIDQMYFALRFSIINSMKEGRFPLILDDCFLQYDDKRLKNILEFLGKVSSEIQILFFTCHHKEKEILDNLGLKYNLITLS